MGVLTDQQYTYLEHMFTAAADLGYLVRDEKAATVDKLIDEVAARPPSAVTPDVEERVDRALLAVTSAQSMADELRMLAGWVR